MTWGEFKKWMKEQGVKDHNEIGYIDFDFKPGYIKRGNSGIEVT